MERYGNREKITIRLSKKSILIFFFVVILAIVSETKFSFHDIAQKAVISLIGFYAVFNYSIGRYNKIQRNILCFLLMGSIPYFLAFFISLFTTMIGLNDGLPTAVHSLTSASYDLLEMLFVSSLFFIFKEKAIDINYYYIVVSYLITIIGSIVSNGLMGTLSLIHDSYHNPLERNDIGTAVALFIMYYLYILIRYKSENYNKKKYINRIIVLFLILILCGKRAAYLGTAIGLVATFLLTRKVKQKKKFCIFLLLLSVLLCFAYVCFIHSRLIIVICNRFGISTFGRIYVWDWFHDLYEISPLYLGRGFQYIHEYMMAGRAGTDGMVNGFGFLHNSILQIYIETGFWGFAFWIGFLLLHYPFKLYKKYGTDCLYISSILMISQLTIFMTDNVLTYPVFQTTLYLLMMSLPVFIEYDDQRKSIDFAKKLEKKSDE